ncbi:hypothetical protein ASG49_05760 [Marmoricola sp. Leaf446]|uniref:hypothetical protein n=1 Tax=Marmoricola sp. Leaf446 TaxID=1736379 RepID=UPI0006F585CC|nr:hypothetical protein [Marmoricola sp. Leaf446]KQT94385.1 hypothetical protein ASG49_05760 [Marmoricola sp. Leaf446]
MTRLLLVELSRFRTRRSIALLVLGTVVAAALVAGLTAYQTRPLTQAERVDAQAQVDLAGRDPQVRSELRACREAPTDYLGPEAEAADCASALLPAADSFYPREALDPVVVREGRGVQVGLLVAGLLIVAGSTFAGGDWGSGSMATQLLFEGRRRRVWLAKAGAVVLGCAVTALVALAAFWAVLLLVARARGVTVGGGELADVALQVGRGVALSAAAGLGAFALTMVFRHTVATLALLFVYAVGGEVAVSLLPIDGAGRWAVGTNAVGWLRTDYTYDDPSATCSLLGRCSQLQVLTHTEAVLFLGVLLVLACVVSLAWFSRRDV